MPVEVVPTYSNVMKIWWAYSWRWLVLGAVIFAIIDFPVLFTGHLLGYSSEFLQKIMGIVLFFISFMVAPQWTIKRLLRKGFGRYRLAMVEK